MRPMEEMNSSEAAGDKRYMEAATMEFAGISTVEIAKHFDVLPVTIRRWRTDEMYQQHIAHLKEEWADQLSKLVTTGELKKKVSKAMEIGVHRLIQILSNPKTRTMDVINGVKLAAQLDGRLLKMQEDDRKPYEPGTDPLAAELLMAINAVRKGTVQ